MNRRLIQYDNSWIVNSRAIWTERYEEEKSLNKERRSHRYSEAQIREWEEISFRNMCEFYKEELTEIMNGGQAKRVFTNQQIKTLKRHEILTVDREWDNGRRVVLTKRAREILRVGR